MLALSLRSVIACLLFVAAVAARANPLLVHRACNADNCARAVTGTRSGLPATETRKADCSSFLQITVSEGFLGPTTIFPDSIPTYAYSQCDANPARYSSACSCYGVPTVTVMPKPFQCDNQNDFKGFDCPCTYSSTCYTKLSGSSYDFMVGSDGGSCADFCSRDPECAAFSLRYFSGDCVFFKAGTYSFGPADDSYITYVKNDKSCAC